MTTATFDIEDPSELDVAPLWCAHEGCTNAVVKPERGRTPKFCPEHRVTGGRSTGASKSKASGKSWPRAAEIETHLTNTVKTLGSVSTVFMGDEFYGEHLQEAGPAVIHELVELAKDDKTLQKWLIWLAAPGKYGPLTSAVGALIMPMFVHATMKAKLAAAMREPAETES